MNPWITPEFLSTNEHNEPELKSTNFNHGWYTLNSRIPPRVPEGAVQQA